jgi:DNA-binding transcriptional LysR family regulator
VNERQLRAFQVVMQHGSVTAAAHALNISQPAVSRLIAELERSVGFPVFLRKGGKIEPTAEGSLLMQEVERMFYGLERMHQVAREIRDLRRAVLHIAAMPMASLEVMPKAIARLLGEGGGIKITHDVHGSARILDLVSSRQVDLGIGQIIGERQGIDIIASYRTSCVCAMAPDHPLAGRDELGPRDLKGHPLVALAHHTVAAGYITQIFAEANVQPEIAVESQPSYTACGLAAAGVGVAIVDPLTPRAFRASLRLVPFRPEIPFDFHVIKSSEAPLTRAASAFCRHLSATLDEFDEATRIRP